MSGLTVDCMWIEHSRDPSGGKVMRCVGCVDTHYLEISVDLPKKTGRPPVTMRAEVSPTIEEAETTGNTRRVIIPDYYGGRDNPYEVFKVIREWELNFFLGNALKYIKRAGKKDPAKQIEDLEKAREYITSEIDHLKSQK